MASDTRFKDLEIACMLNIFTQLTPKECGRAACVSLLWREVAADGLLWQDHLAADFATSSCTSPGGHAAPSFK